MAVHKLWSYYDKPNWVLNPDDIECQDAGWVDTSTGELLVCIPRFEGIRDDLASNLEMEDGNDLLQEDADHNEPKFILL